MTAAVDAASPTMPSSPAGDAGEWPVRFPVMAVEDFDTSDGRYLTPGEIMARSCPLSILAQPSSAHGGQEPPAAELVGRLDRMERVPGPSVISRRTGEPFPEGTFIWQGYGAVDPTLEAHGRNIGNLLRRRMLNGASVDLAGMDVEMVGEGELAVDPAHPRRQMVAHSAEIAAVTLVPIPAFADAYVELIGDDRPFEPASVDAIAAEGLAASAFPAWRSAEVGDYAALVAAGGGPHTGGMIALIPADPDALTVEGGDPAEQMHLTLAYLGDDVTGWDDEAREGLLGQMQQVVDAFDPIQAEVMGHALFNPTGAHDREPCAVHLVTGETLPDIKRAVASHDKGDHPLFIPHVTAGYGIDVSALSFVGPVVFDRLRIALADEVTDFPLGGATEAAEPKEVAAVTADGAADEEHSDMPDSPPVGMPDAPQSCPGGDDEHPAVVSLIYGEGTQYAATCAEHRPDAEAEIAAGGFEIEQEVPIPVEDEDVKEDPVPETIVAAGAAARFARRVALQDPVTAAAAAPLPVEDVFLDEVITAPTDAHRRPPLAWFVDPGFTELTPITIDGARVYGHIADRSRPHLSFAGQNVMVPTSRCDYGEFMRGGVRVMDGETVRVASVGHLTFDTGHADGLADAATAARHYDHTGFSWARVAAGDDQFGIWVNGILRPGITEDQIDTALAHPPSGDWRPVKGNLELVAALCVNTPGFGVARARVASGQMQALIASTGLPSRRLDVPAGFDADALADRIVTTLESRRRNSELSAEHAGLVAELDDTPTVVAALLAEVDDTPRVAAALLDELDDDAGDLAVSRMPPQLQAEWLSGGIAARIAWGTPGSFGRCQAIAREKGVPGHQIDGMCANLKRKAEGAA